MISKIIMKSVFGATAALGIVAVTVPSVFASTISIATNNDATVTNTVSVTANTGGNYTQGGAGGEGGESSSRGDSRSSYRDKHHSSNNSDSAGGNGGNGGNGGHIETGDAIATADIKNEVNTTDLSIEDNSSDENAYNESLSASSEEAAMRYAAHNNESRSSENAAGSYSEKGASSSHDDKSGSVEEWSEDGKGHHGTDKSGYAEDYDASKGEHEMYGTNASHTQSASESNKGSSQEGEAYLNKQKLEYTRTYVGGRDTTTIATNNGATVKNDVSSDAQSGHNETIGGEGATGASGRSGGEGGQGGSGGNVVTGRADSLAQIVTTSGRTIARIVRN